MLHNQQFTPPFRFITKESLLISVYCSVTVIICKMPAGIKQGNFDSTFLLLGLVCARIKNLVFYRTE